MRVNRRLEIVRFDTRPDRNGYFVVQVAVDGKLAVPMDMHVSDYQGMSAERFEAKLLHDGEALLRHYGDHRYVKFREDGSYISLMEGSESQSVGA